MAWKPGESGNPGGRPKLDGESRAQLRAQILEGAPAVIAKLMAKAKKGDVFAARTLLERVLPTMRPESPPVAVPGVEVAANFTDAAHAVLKAAAAGEITLDDGARLLAGIGSVARTAEIDELARRIERLEGKGCDLA